MTIDLPVQFRRSLWARAMALVFLAATCQTAVAVEPADSKAPKETTEKMSDSWSRTLPVSDPPDAKFGEWRAWVEGGWLMAERRAEGGDIEWKIVLAKVVGDELPEMVVNRIRGTFGPRNAAPQGGRPLPGPSGPIPGGLRLSYRDGRYFIRDDFGSLRCLREQKTDEVSWPEMPLPPRDPNPKSGQVRAPQLGPVTSNGWIVAHAGPQRPLDQIVADCLVRLVHQDLEEPGGTQVTFRPGVRRLTRGRWFVVDDGELLVAERLESHDLQNEINRRAQQHRMVTAGAARRKLSGAPPPDLSGDAWLNADTPPKWDALKGSVVLLVLFDLKQPAFTPLVAPLLGFEESYGQQGLKVVGVYANGPRDEIEQQLAEARVKFPVLVDDGKVAERFGLGYSGCVLIDREGNVASAYKDSLAPPAEIEKLLQAKK